MKRILLLTYVLACLSYAQKPAFDPQYSTGDLYEYSEYIQLGDDDYNIEDVIEKSTLNFEDLNSENHDLGFSSDTYWVRFKLKNSSNIGQSYYLSTARPITDVVNLYSIGDRINVQTSGDQIPFEERDVDHRQAVFRIHLEPKSTKQFYIELKSDGETINIPLNLYNESEFVLNNYKQQLFLGLFYGVLLLAGLIYLFFYKSLKNKAFLYYGLYVLSIALMQAALDGFVYQYFLPGGGYLNSRMVLISALFSNLFLLKYCEYFLNIEANLPRFKKLYNTLYVAISIVFIMLFINTKTLELAYPISNFNGLLSLILILTSVFLMRYRKKSIDPYFSIGIFFLVVGLLGFVMNNLGMLPTNFYTMNSSKFGTGFEVVFLSLSMTNLLRKLREEKEKSQELALKKSEEISELKTYFMSNMSHELRTPINAIMGVVETELANKASTKEERVKYQLVRNATVSLLSNVNDILDFEKMEKNELRLKNEVFNPSIAINQISENWKTEALRKGLKYHFKMDPEITTKAIGDVDRMVQILNNVLSNAIKFTHKGAIGFKLKCVTQPNSISKFIFHVSDTGVGMDAESKEIVFDSFSQMRLNHKRQFGGIGLGLTIAKYLVDLFNGTIKIESEINKGTDVYIEIPLEVDNSTRIDVIKSQPLQDPKHVLVVEDNKINQVVMRKLLNSFENITFSVVENGKEAIEALKKGVYDLILMDLQMPVMDGYEATERIRSGELGDAIGSIPIIAVTGDAMQETRERVLNIGMNDYMTKPVKRDLLFEKIKNCSKDKNTLSVVA
ncbi:hybrid sensor histidine kinase/response regulator [Winogradskyella sp.]|uniref:hybrid sensor histidine kinase/response regulator n=1 Tax=Winogradskyella sp. TaxID=1883156 RepID=UPI001B102738|nr:hybrid sensor histidine kinase/response regulator [Winogradskyella sp.]MBO6879389.1 response regulator [Winogradskyella sp.]